MIFFVKTKEYRKQGKPGPNEIKVVASENNCNEICTRETQLQY